MQIVADGIIFESQGQGGVSRIYQEIFPRMCNIEQTLKIDLLTSGRLRQSLPAHENITNHFFPPLEYLMRPAASYFTARKNIRAFLQHFLLKIPQNCIWNSTYYTLPHKWKGPIVVIIYDMIHERFPEVFRGNSFDLFRYHKERCITRADAVICISETTRQDLKNFYNIDKINSYVVPLAHSPAFAMHNHSTQFKDLHLQKPFILYIGGRTNYKNFQLLLNAYNHWQKRKEVDLVVVGQEWSKSEKQLIAHHSLEKQISLVTGADDKTLSALYNQALAFIYPSLYEGFGIPLLEAMACNCPIVASTIPSTVEVAKDYPIYFESQDVESLIAALDRAYRESDGIKHTQLGLTRADQYSWNNTAQQVLDIYSTLAY